ncbi:MAG TPA: multicopper oxidase domain-containing protein [Acidimicrobiales bacterium]|nr:multicopper oxidase domain-containing protein [Acidimicrobiales bacterium]
MAEILVEPRPERSERREGISLVAVAVALMSLVVAIASVGFSMRAIDEAEEGGGAAGGEVVAAEASVVLTEFAITPDQLDLGPDGTITATNEGTVQHDLAVRGEEDGYKMDLLSAGGSGTLDLAGLDDGSYELYCTVAGHADAGMTASLTVSEGGATAGTTPPAGGGELSADEMDESAHERVLQFPAETKGQGGQALEPTVLDDGTKRFDLTVDVVEWEVEPGRVVEAWAYNGQVPGPTLKVQVGDKVEMRVTNNLNESTTVHWHGIDVPNEMDGVPDVTQEQIKAGDTFTYAFEITEPAVGMYHAHSNSQKQVPMGLLAGMLVSEMPVPEGVTVSQELPFILNDGGELGFTINGKAFPATAPVTAEIGETILVHYYNEGLQVHPMHLHGPDQLVIAKDGNPLPQPYKADTVLVGPGERYSVLVTPNRPGTWVWHCHILTHAEAPEGFIGMTTALVVP